METKRDTKRPIEDIAIARADFCWETKAWSGRVLHYYGNEDGTLVSYPTPQEIESANKKHTK